MKKGFRAFKAGDPLALVLMLVIALVFVSVLAICFSILISDSDRQVRSILDSGADGRNNSEQKAQTEKLDPQNISVAMLSGTVMAVEEDRVVIKAEVYGQPEHEFTLVFNDNDQQKIFKYQQAPSNNRDSIAKLEKEKFDFDNLQQGDLLTVSFPLGVPMKEIDNGALEYDQIIVDDEYDPNMPKE